MIGKRLVLLCSTSLASALLTMAVLVMTVPARAATAPLACTAFCVCNVVVGSEVEEYSPPSCYDETTMTLVSSLQGCCQASGVCGLDTPVDCEWTVDIDVSTNGNCCLVLERSDSLGGETVLAANSCSSDPSVTNSFAIPCGERVQYELYADDAVCPSSGDAACLANGTSVWYQGVRCKSFPCNGS